ncbi:MAG: hypothetical protein PGN34_08570 [Methylobacterium frigidaeris]
MMHTRIFATSVPKSGTHFLTQIFNGMGYNLQASRKYDKYGLDIRLLDEKFRNAEHACIYGHWRYNAQSAQDLAEYDYKIICLIRDPRDICLSMADYILRGSPRGAHESEPGLRSLTKREAIIATIKGFGLPNFKSKSIDKVCEGWLDWKNAGGIVLKYEDIITSVANQSPIATLQQVRVRPTEFLNSATSEYQSTKSATMNVGKAARWRSEFDDELSTIWNERAEGVATAWGYEET